MEAEGARVIDTKQRIIDATIETLKEEGFAGTSARAIARRGGFNQALIFYHFGTLTDLLLAAMDEASADRITRYNEAVNRAPTIQAKIEAVAALYKEDLATGRVTVASELIAGSIGRPDLRPEMAARMEPWLDLTEETMREVLSSVGLSRLLEPRLASFAAISFFIGFDLFSNLQGDDTYVDKLLSVAARIAPVLQVATKIFGGGAKRRAR